MDSLEELPDGSQVVLRTGYYTLAWTCGHLGKLGATTFEPNTAYAFVSGDSFQVCSCGGKPGATPWRS